MRIEGDNICKAPDAGPGIYTYSVKMNILSSSFFVSQISILQFQISLGCYETQIR